MTENIDTEFSVDNNHTATLAQISIRGFLSDSNRKVTVDRLSLDSGSGQELERDSIELPIQITPQSYQDMAFIEQKADGATYVLSYLHNPSPATATIDEPFEIFKISADGTVQRFSSSLVLGSNRIQKVLGAADGKVALEIRELKSGWPGFDAKTIAFYDAETGSVTQFNAPAGETLVPAWGDASNELFAYTSALPGTQVTCTQYAFDMATLNKYVVTSYSKAPGDTSCHSEASLRVTESADGSLVIMSDYFIWNAKADGSTTSQLPVMPLEVWDHFQSPRRNPTNWSTTLQKDLSTISFGNFGTLSTNWPTSETYEAVLYRLNYDGTLQSKYVLSYPEDRNFPWQFSYEGKGFKAIQISATKALVFIETEGGNHLGNLMEFEL